MLVRHDPQVDGIAPSYENDIFNLDGRGKNLSRITYSIANTVIRYGHAGILVFPSRQGHPTWSVYKPDRILGWRFGENKERRVLIQVRLEEHVQIPSGKYGTKTVRQVRVLTPGKWELWRETERSDQEKIGFALPYGQGGGQFEMVEQGAVPFGTIPFAVAYSDICDHDFISVPPLRELAMAAARSYAVTANRQQLLDLAAAPTLAIIGQEVESGCTQKVGPSYVIHCRQGSDVKWLEASGVSFQALKDQLKEIDEEIDTLGMAAIVSQKMGSETAEAKRLDHVDGSTAMAIISQNIEKALNDCFTFHSMYRGQTAPPWPLVALNRDFVSERLSPQDIVSLLSIYNNNLVTAVTVLQLLKEGYVLPSSLDPEKELSKIAEEKEREMFMNMNMVEDEEEEEESRAQPN